MSNLIETESLSVLYLRNSSLSFVRLKLGKNQRYIVKPNKLALNHE